MAEKKHKDSGSIVSALRVSVFPRGIRRFADHSLTKADLTWWFDRLRKRIEAIMDSQAEDDPDKSPYYCLDVPRPDEGPGCTQEICYNELGQVVHRGPVQCPPR